MKSIEILVSTMNQSNCEDLISKMDIREKCVIINQIPNNDIQLPEVKIDDNVKFLSFHERGLSKSRNKAITNSSADICVIADDDMYYEKDAKEKILNAYEKYPNADVIAFYVDNEDEKNRKKILKEGKVDFLKSMKISSVQITFKRESILKNDIKIKEEFGAGAKYNFGEENIFLAECLRKGLKIYYVPEKIATLYKDTVSTWSREQTEEHYNIQGAVYYEISKWLYPILILQFALRKRNLYIDKMSMTQVQKYMYAGVKKYKASKKKKIYMMGDFVSNTGPAIVNKNYYNYLKDDVYVCKTNNKLKRVLHFYSNIIKCDVLLISGLSKFHSQSCNIAKKLGKKVIYLMHGYSKMESKINEIESIMLEDEEKIFILSDKILCVSENFANFFKKENPSLAEKIEFVNNGIEIKRIEKKQRNSEQFTIISVGGGVKIKNNLAVCKAIEKIENIKIKFIVIGKTGKDGEKIKKYDFVEYYEYLPHETVMEKMRQSDLYIQNSYSETFGLAIFEAISNGCKILISKNIGALSIINKIKESIIDNNNNIDEIMKKIIYQYEHRNETINYIDQIDEYTWEKSAQKIKKKIEGLK